MFNVMPPTHRPATASTSNPMQLPASSASVMLHAADPSPRMRKDAQEVKFGVGRHRDKLEKIRDSLRPYEQPSVADKTTKNESKYSNNNRCLEENLQNNRQMMLNALTQIHGYPLDSAIQALEQVNYSSVIAASEYLDNRGKGATKGSFYQGQNGSGTRYSPPSSLNLTTDASSMVNNNMLYITQRSSLGSSNVAMECNGSAIPRGYSQVSSSLYTVDDSSSSRSESPHTRAISPIPFSVRSSSPPKQFNFPQNGDYCRNHATQNIVLQRKNGYEHFVAAPCSSHMPPLHHNFIPVACSSKAERCYPSSSGVSATDKSNLGVGCERIFMSKHYLKENGVSRRIETHPYYDSHLDRAQNVRYQFNFDAPQLVNESNRRNVSRLNPVEDLCEPYLPHANSNVLMETQTQTVYLNLDVPSTDNSDFTESQRRITRRNIFAARDPMLPFDRVSLGGLSLPLSSSAPGTPDVSPKSAGPAVVVTPEGVRRCTSPLPESISKKVHANKFESEIKPYRPRLFCFFMEQHVERLIHQHKERKQRAQQLVKEMESANLPEMLREQLMKILAQKESRYLRLRRQKMNKDMFTILKHIGCGAFGVVSLVKKKDTGQVYAMKTLNKKDIIKKNQAAHVKAERDILALADSRWIVKLYFSFQDSQSLYFVMEYVPGGDMMQLLILKGFFEERLARFYIAELTCAIEYVHSLGFIHRDIKPDNILIGEKGHLKLTDFGLCTGLQWTHDKKYYDVDSEEFEETQDSEGNKNKVLLIRNRNKKNNSDSLVGTDNYMAPEVIRKTGHTQLCDWWSVGVILYEMVIGRPPFMSQDRESTQAKIKRWDRYLDLENPMAQKLSRECIDFMKRLICEQEVRLGKNGGATEVKQHAWFKGINFASIGSTVPEYIPSVKHPEDTSNFDTFELDTNRSFDTPGLKNGGRTLDSASPAFYEFTFRHFFDFDKKGCPSLKQRPSLAPLIETDNSPKLALASDHRTLAPRGLSSSTTDSDEC